MSWRRATRLLQGLFAILYPLMVYGAFRLDRAREAALALLAVFGCILATALLAREPARAWAVPALATSVVGLSILPGASRVLLSMPVLTNLALLGVFGISQLRGNPMVLRFARAWDPQLSEERQRYCFKLNLVWCLFFLLNASLSAVLAVYAPVSWWALYTGVIAYLAAASLAGGEYLFRLWRFRGSATA